MLTTREACLLAMIALAMLHSCIVAIRRRGKNLNLVYGTNTREMMPNREAYLFANIAPAKIYAVVAIWGWTKS